MILAHDTMLIFQRQLRLSMRSPAWVVIGLVQPVIYLAFFGPLLVRLARDVAPGFPGGDSWRFFVPGLLVQLGLFGSAFVGFAVIADWRAGVIERMRVTPVSRLALLLGRVLRDAAVLLVQGVVLVLAGVAFGLRAPLPGVLIALGFVAVLAVSLASLSYTVALLTRSDEALAPLLNLVTVPLMLLSGIMLPMTLAPTWLDAVSRATPLRYIIDAMRDALAGHYGSTAMYEGGAVAVVLAVLCVAAGARAFRKENA